MNANNQRRAVQRAFLDSVELENYQRAVRIYHANPDCFPFIYNPGIRSELKAVYEITKTILGEARPALGPPQRGEP